MLIELSKEEAEFLINELEICIEQVTDEINTEISPELRDTQEHSKTMLENIQKKVRGFLEASKITWREAVECPECGSAELDAEPSESEYSPKTLFLCSSCKYSWKVD